MSTKSSPYRTSSQHSYTMSCPHLHSQADSGYQQRTAQSPHTLPAAPAPGSQSTEIVRVETVLTIGRGEVEYFAKIRTDTYKWEPISEAVMQKLLALNIPTRTVLDGEPSGDSSFAGNEPEQRYVSKSSSTISRWYRILQIFLGLSQAPHSQHRLTLRTAASIAPALFFNHRSTTRSSQPRVSEMSTGRQSASRLSTWRRRAATRWLRHSWFARRLVINIRRYRQL